jgi:hypothetical protein
MHFDLHSFARSNPESWLIILIYAGFWGYSYYSLIKLLLHICQQDNLAQEEEKSLEIN